MHLFTQVNPISWIKYLLIKHSGLFNYEYYLKNYPTVENAKVNPIFYYITYGWKQGHNPSELFDTRYYLNANEDVLLSGINPLIHYIRYGKFEGRQATPSRNWHQTTYLNWIESYDTLTEVDRKQILTHLRDLQNQPLISIFMVADNVETHYLNESINSVLKQHYRNWEMFISFSDPKIKDILEDYEQKDARIELNRFKSNKELGTAFHTSLHMCKGEFLGLLNPMDILREHALYLIVYEINNFPEAEIIYSDRDLVNERGERCEPYFKPDWNPDLFFTHNFIKHFGVYKTQTAKIVGGFRKDFEGAEDWDLALRISEKGSGTSIRHVPYVLYHHRLVDNLKSPHSSLDHQIKESEFNAIKSHFERLNQEVRISQCNNDCWRVEYLLKKPYPLVSIIIPTKNQARLLGNCIKKIQKNTLYPNYEIIIVNNQTEEKSALDLLSSLQKENGIIVLDYHHPFNYSDINNFAAKTAKGKILVFLNNDTEVISQNWLGEMINNALRPEIGAVGAMLYYPDYSVQHAGLILNKKYIALHAFHKSERDAFVKNMRAGLTQNFSAVTAACLAIEKSKFELVHGFDQNNLRIAYNDVDLCLRLVKAGFRNLWTPHAELIHYESASRGYEDNQQKQDRIKFEADFMRLTWGDLLEADPSYNPNLTADLPDFSLAFPPRVIKPWNTEAFPES